MATQHPWRLSSNALAVATIVVCKCHAVAQEKSRALRVRSRPSKIQAIGRSRPRQFQSMSTQRRANVPGNIHFAGHAVVHPLVASAHNRWPCSVRVGKSTSDCSQKAIKGEFLPKSDHKRFLHMHLIPQRRDAARRVRPRIVLAASQEIGQRDA